MSSLTVSFLTVVFSLKQAYACLSDKLKRDAFNLERRRSHCSNCSLKVQAHAAGHGLRPSAEVQKPNPLHHSNTFNGSRSWVNETDNFQNLRDRAKARVDTLEREWGSKRSKWIQQLATVRQRYKGSRTYESPAPTPVKSHSSTRRDSLSPFRCHEEAKPREAQFARSQSNCGVNVGSGPELNTGVGQERRSSTSDANGERATKIEENLDSLLRRLKAENTSTTREYSMLRDFGVHVSTPEAEHMLRPLNGRRMARTASLDRRWSRTDAGQGFSCIPKGRCLSKKVYSPVAAVNLSAAYSDRANRKVSTSDGKSQSFSKGDISFRGVERTKSASELGKTYHPTVSKEEHLGGQTISKTASGTWTERVQVHSKMFDEFVTSVFPSTAQTPIHSQSASSDRASSVFRGPVGCTIDGSKGPNTMPPSKPSVDSEQKKIQRESSFPSERKVSSSGRERSTIPISKDGSDGRSLHQIRLPLGTRSENVSSYSNNLNQGSNVFKACKIDKQKEAHLEHVEDLQQKQVCSYPLMMLLHETNCWQVLCTNAAQVKECKCQREKSLVSYSF